MTSSYLAIESVHVQVSLIKVLGNSATSCLPFEQSIEGSSLTQWLGLFVFNKTMVSFVVFCHPLLTVSCRFLKMRIPAHKMKHRRVLFSVHEPFLLLFCKVSSIYVYVTES